MLFDYLKQVQRFVHDSKQELLDPEDLIVYVNRARREVAMRTMSVRVLTPITGSIESYTITANGAAYTNPSVTITPPDFPSGTLPFPNGAQATATASMQGGQIIGINNNYGGAGYFQPVVTINDPTGSGAAAVATTNALNVLQQAQEVYPFSGVNLSANPGVKSVYSVRSISIIYANYRYSLPVYSFSTYQSMIRQYPFQYQYVPTMASQYGRGTNGSFYVYPIPSATYQYELDCFCLPSDLATDQDFEAVPEPWTDAVPWMAAHLAFLELQNLNAAAYYLDQFDKWIHRHSFAAQPGRVSNPYGRFIFLLSAGLSAALSLGAMIC
jgi:hypothetical protein